jgi:hypothetical protein
MLRALAAVALATVAVTTAPAVAAPPEGVQHQGGCGFDLFAVPREDVYRGAVYAYVAAYSFAPERSPVTVTALRCEIRIEGEVRVSVAGRVAGPVGVVDPAPVEYTAAASDIVDLCTVLDTVDATGTAASVTFGCGGAENRCPPEGWCGFEWLLEDTFATVDPIVCAITGGDVYVAGELVYYCPPYADN